MVVGKHLYSAHVPSSPGQEREVGVASATGTGGTARGRLGTEAQGHLPMAHQRGSVGLHLKVHFGLDQGRKPNSSEGVEAWHPLLLLDLVSEALDF